MMKPELFESIETPAVLLDRSKLIDNIKKMQDLADKHHVNLRPHIKTHKSIKIANLQIEQGASGITASKVDEALVFLKAGINSITFAQGKYYISHCLFLVCFPYFSFCPT